MDALKFIEERNRMCDYYSGDNALSGCAECPAFQMTCVSVRSVTAEYIAAVEQWSKEHPRKTRQDVFLEQWPNCMMGDNGIIGMCPRNVDKMCVCNLSQSCRCADCRREFWMQEVE